MNNKNIKILYILSFLRQAWFWLGVWVFFYLSHTNYAGIGFLEAMGVFMLVIMEIPSGAITDLVGKKNSLKLSFFFLVVGNVIMAFAPSYGFLVLSVALLGFGSAFYSGTAEAFAFDSLKEEKKEKYYDKVISNIKTLQLVAMSLSGIIGGFMYAIFPGLPFLVTGLFCFVGLVLTFFIKEPRIDSEKVTWENFKTQTRQGLRQLTKSLEVKRRVSYLLLIGFFMVVGWEMLNDVLGVEFGFKPSQLGVLSGVICLVAAGVSQVTPYLKGKFRMNNLFVFITVLTALSFMVSPVAGLIIGGLSLVSRASFQVISDNLTSVIINENTESKYRVTTLSTFNLIKKIPYVAFAYFVGSLMDVLSASRVAFFLGIILLVLALILKSDKKVVI